MLYCLEYLVKNIDWLIEKIERLRNVCIYFLIDCPGQVELFTMHGSLFTIVELLKNRLHMRLATVNLVDCSLCCDPSKFMSAILISLSTMLHLELPYVSVLAKFDTFRERNKVDGLSLQNYTNMDVFAVLFGQLVSSNLFSSRYLRLSANFLKLIDSYCLSSFIPLNIQVFNICLRLKLQNLRTGIFAGAKLFQNGAL